MIDWFYGLEWFPKLYWSIALLASFIFIITIGLSLAGGDTDEFGDVDADIEGDTGIGFQFITLKNLVGFFTIFGWSGIACIDADFSYSLTVVISIICGLAMMGIGKIGWVDKVRPICGPMDAICRPIAVAPCTSDIHTVWAGALGDRHELILGHEAVGEVVEIGSEVKDFKIGDKVLVPAITTLATVTIDVTAAIISGDIAHNCCISPTSSVIIFLHSH